MAKESKIIEEEAIRKTMISQREPFDNFIKKIRLEKENLLKETEQKLYQDSLSADEENLINFMVKDRKFFKDLSEKNPEHAELINNCYNVRIDKINGDFAGIFPEQYSEQQKQEAEEKADNIYNSSLKKKEPPSMTQEVTINSIDGHTGNKEVNSILEKISTRQAARKQLFSNADSIREGGQLFETNFDNGIKDYKQAKKDLNVAIVNLKSDIYLLTDLKSKATDNSTNDSIDSQIKNLMKAYEDVSYDIGKDHKRSKEKMDISATGLHRGGESYNLIMNNSPERIARIIEQFTQHQEQKSKINLLLLTIETDLRLPQREENIIFNVDDFLNQAHPDVVLKIQAIQKELDKRAQSQTGGLKETIDKFFNCLAKLVGGGVKNHDIANLHKAMLAESRSNRIDKNSLNKEETYKHTQLNELKNQLNKFISTTEIKPNSKAEQVTKNRIQNQNGERGKY